MDLFKQGFENFKTKKDGGRDFVSGAGGGVGVACMTRLHFRQLCLANIQRKQEGISLLSLV
jgi:hypothetical protein